MERAVDERRVEGEEGVFFFGACDHVQSCVVRGCVLRPSGTTRKAGALGVWMGRGGGVFLGRRSYRGGSAANYKRCPSQVIQEPIRVPPWAGVNGCKEPPWVQVQ